MKMALKNSRTRLKSKDAAGEPSITAIGLVSAKPDCNEPSGQSMRYPVPISA